VCRNIADGPRGLSFFCGDKYARVEQDEAEKFLMLFYGRAGGPDPGRAYELLTDAERQRVSGDSFAQGWEDVAGAELLGIEPTDRHNAYEVTVRHYEAEDTPKPLPPGQVVVRRSEVELRKLGGVVQLEKASSPDRVAVERDGHTYPLHDHRYPRAELLRQHGTFREPSTTSGHPAAFDTEFRVGGILSVLCTLSPPDSAQSFMTEDWVRTPQGWIPAAVLSAPDGFAPTCDPRYGIVRQFD
jgi:hypothetical protein